MPKLSRCAAGALVLLALAREVATLEGAWAVPGEHLAIAAHLLLVSFPSKRSSGRLKQ